MFRRSTIEVHTNVSGALDLRSSIPHQNADLSKSQLALRQIIPWPESTKGISQNQVWQSDDCGSRNPVFRKQNSGNVLPLSYNGSVRVFVANQDRSALRANSQLGVVQSQLSRLSKNNGLCYTSSMVTPHTIRVEETFNVALLCA